ncbi:MAG TPA: signal peptidase I [Candidatus Saccharimonadia bacterium]|nr:signal peptidase I [Candidatus Saccharimonadia bacterium]
MDFDFAALLVALTAFTGIVWAIDRVLFAPNRRKRAAALEAGAAGSPEERQALVDRASREPVLVEYCRSFFPVILAVLVIRSFLAEPFRIPSSSMMPTLLIGDFILVNKFAFGLRLPVTNSKLVEIGEPARGDVVVFRYPGMAPDDPSRGTDYIKRVVGVPGDSIMYRDKIVYVNGEPQPQRDLGTYVGTGAGVDMTGTALKLENLDGTEHEILVRRSDGFFPMREGTFSVPPGAYFVLGDNRDNSQDSRYWGFVPEGNLVGKAFFIWMNWDSKNGGVEFARIGTVIE